jgi:hypothetical protein
MLGPTEFIPTTHFEENWDKKVRFYLLTLDPVCDPDTRRGTGHYV